MRKKGFTLIELMVVILIVAILAAVLAPLIHGRIDAAKWSEGRAGAGTIASAARAYWAEHQADPLVLADAPTLLELFPDNGAGENDLDGKYFDQPAYALAFTQYDNSGCDFAVTVTAASSTRSNKPTSPATMVLTVGSDGTSDWTD
jgi:type IV pilus assembly protein PilA